MCLLIRSVLVLALPAIGAIAGGQDGFLIGAPLALIIFYFVKCRG